MCFFLFCGLGCNESINSCDWVQLCSIEQYGLGTDLVLC